MRALTHLSHADLPCTHSLVLLSPRHLVHSLQSLPTTLRPPFLCLSLAPGPDNSKWRHLTLPHPAYHGPNCVSKHIVNACIKHEGEKVGGSGRGRGGGRRRRGFGQGQKFTACIPACVVVVGLVVELKGAVVSTAGAAVTAGQIHHSLLCVCVCVCLCVCVCVHGEEREIGSGQT